MRRDTAPAVHPEIVEALGALDTLKEFLENPLAQGILQKNLATIRARLGI